MVVKFSPKLQSLVKYLTFYDRKLRLKSNIMVRYNSRLVIYNSKDRLLSPCKFSLVSAKNGKVRLLSLVNFLILLELNTLTYSCLTDTKLDVSIVNSVTR